jgi:hypothetical protein
MVETNDLVCGLVDYAAVAAAEAQHTSIQGCSMIPAFAISMKPAPDMIVPIFVCFVHFNAFKLSLHEGVGVDEDVFGEFPKH